MPRNHTSINAKKGNITKLERDQREQMEEEVKQSLPKIQPPTWLTKDLQERFIWYAEQAKGLDNLTVLDSSLLARYVVYENRFIQLEKAIQGQPTVIDNRINPLLTEQRQTHDKMEKLESKLGFNPSDRLRFVLPQEEKTDQLEAFRNEL